MSSRRRETKEWEPWFNFSEDGKVIECVFCASRLQYKRERAFNHYGFRAKSNKAVCRKAPPAVKMRFANCGGEVPARMRGTETWGTSAGPCTSAGTSPSAHSTHGNVPDGGVGDVPIVRHEPSESFHQGSRGASCTARSSSLRQQQITAALHMATRLELDEKWAAFFYDANVPFNVVKNAAFIEAVKATSRAGFLYEPPAYNALRTSLLNARKKHVHDEVQKGTKYSMETYGATISTDGWDNVVHRPLMNVMLCCPAGDIFLGSVDTTGNKKTREYISGELRRYIDQVGPHLITQVCTDNAANMLGAMDDIVATYPHMTKQGCTAHALDLFLEDWAKVPQFKSLIINARRVCLYIRNHHVPMALFREASNLQLLMPAETRFACNLLMIQRLVEVRPALEEVVQHPNFTEYVAGLFNRQNGHRARALAGLVKATIEDPNFWHRCVNYEQMLKDIIVGLRIFDGREPAMGRAWLAMNNMKKHVFSLRHNPFYVPARVATHLEESFMKRWDMVRTDLHLAGALLNPYLRDVVEVQENGDFKRALNRVVRKLSPVVGVNFNEVMMELTEYEERQGPYNPLEAPDIREVNLQPHQWWHRVGDRALSKIASRILSLTCSASSCERNWSMYSFVHNKSRNRLGTKKAEALVYIYANSRLLRQRAVADPIRWYDNNILSEESDPDGGGDSDSDYGGDDDLADDDDADPNDAGIDDEEDIFDDYNGEDNANAPLEGGNGPGFGVFDWEGVDAEDQVAQAPMGIAVVAHSDDSDNNDHSREDYDDVRDDDDEDDDNDHYDGGDQNGLNRDMVVEEQDVVHEVGDSAEVNQGSVGNNNSSDGGWHGNNTPHDGCASINDSTGIGGVNPREMDTTDSNMEGNGTALPTIGNASEAFVDKTSTMANSTMNEDARLSSGTHGYGASSGRQSQKPSSMGATLVGLSNASQQGSGKPPLPRGPPTERGKGVEAPTITLAGSSRYASSQKSMGPSFVPSSTNTVLRKEMTSHRRGTKRSNVGILPFLDVGTHNGTGSGHVVTVPGGPQVDSDADDPLAKRRKRLVRTNVHGEDNIELRNENSEIEGLMTTNYGDEDDLFGNGDDEREDENCDEAPCDGDVRVRSLPISRGGPPRRSGRLRSTS